VYATLAAGWTFESMAMWVVSLLVDVESAWRRT
jgi:hypothetical protein